MFDWTKFADLAKQLAQNGDEASNRSALNRSYYAVFNKGRDVLRVQGIILDPDRKIHDRIWSEYEKGDSVQKSIGQYGRQLLRFRVHADYQNPYPANLAQNVEVSLSLADRTLHKLSQ